VIFVGCTNAGTELANHENWKTLVDFYTTMVAGANRLLALHPGSRLVGVILDQGIKIIGSLVKYMAQDAVADNAVPGLAAMRPKGSLVMAMNEPPASRRSRASATLPLQEVAAPPEPETVWCYAHASMPEEAIIDKKTTIEVTLSRDKIMKIAGVSAAGGGEVCTDKELRGPDG
jgi:hypothetical protein